MAPFAGGCSEQEISPREFDGVERLHVPRTVGCSRPRPADVNASRT